MGPNDKFDLVVKGGDVMVRGGTVSLHGAELHLTSDGRAVASASGTATVRAAFGS